MIRTLRFVGFALALLAAGPAAAQNFVQRTDIVFVIDASRSMNDEIAAVRSGLSAFAGGLAAFNVDPRFAIVLFGIQPEIVFDFSPDVSALSIAFGQINTVGAVPGFQLAHNSPGQDTREAGLEAICMVLGASPVPMAHPYQPQTGGVLQFRPGALINLILVTDADSDQPFWLANRFPGQADLNPPAPANFGGGWQAEVDSVSTAVIQRGAFVNMLIRTTGDDTRGARKQYGNWACDVSDANLLNFDPAATLACLESSSNGISSQSLQAQVLRAGLIGRTFNINQVNTPNFIANFFAAKIEEIVGEPPVRTCLGTGCPCNNDDPGAGCANSMGSGADLRAIGSASVAADDLVLLVNGVPPGRFGMIYLGRNAEGCAPWGDGLRAVLPGPPAAFLRLGIQNSGPSGAFVQGPGLIGAAMTLPAQVAITPGSTWHFQAYYRDDPGPSPCGHEFNLSNGLRLTFTQ